MTSLIYYIEKCLTCFSKKKVFNLYFETYYSLLKSKNQSVNASHGNFDTSTNF